MRTSYRQQLFVLLLSICVSALGSSILNPLVPQLFSSHHALFPATSYTIYGFLIASYPLAQFCSSFVLSGLSDRWGRKRLLLISLIGTAVGYAGFVAALSMRNLELLFLARIVDGLTGGNIGITQAAIADITPGEKRSSNFGKIGGAYGIGLIAGPLLGGVLATGFSIVAPFGVACAVALINVALVARYLPADMVSSAASSLGFRDLLVKVRVYARIPRLRNLLGTIFLYNAAMVCFNAFFAVYLIQRYHASSELVGLFYTYVGITYASCQFFLVPWVNRRYTARRILAVGLPLLAATMLLDASLFVLPLLFVINLAFTFANGVSQPNLTGLLSNASPSHEQGKVLGLSASLYALAQAIVPALVGGSATALRGGMPLVIAAVLMALAGIAFAYAVVPALRIPKPAVAASVV